ncbi:MAG TPA: hypothetical protein VJN44_07725 [Roseateles sp.]|nr:hypothetical protein [Roseateles sp.]
MDSLEPTAFFTPPHGAHPSADVALDVELLLSTPLSIVVRARAEFDDGSAAQEAGLVIARQACRGDRPRRAALLAAATLCVARLARCGDGMRRVSRLQVRVQGRWQALDVARAARRPDGH